MIIINSTELSERNVVPYSGASYVFRIQYTESVSRGLISSPAVSDSAITCTQQGGGTSEETTEEQYLVTVSANTGASRTSYVLFSYIDNNQNTFTLLMYFQQNSATIRYAPIWKDIFYTSTGTSNYNYSIRYNGSAVFYGKVYCPPGGGGSSANINRVCSAYMNNQISQLDATDVVVDNDAVGTFEFVNDSGVTVGNYVFLNCWGGEFTGASTINLSKPINGHCDPRMKALYTLYNNTGRSINYKIDD